MELYGRFTEKVFAEMNQLGSIETQLEFLYDTKSRFLAQGNKNTESDQVVDWLNNQIEKLEMKYKLAAIKSEVSASAGTLSLAQIALIHIYENKIINSSNADRIAQAAGWKSGKALLKQYYKFLNKLDRINSSGDRADKYKIRLLQSVIPYLKTETSVNQVSLEVKTLQERF